ncbi:helix-turn-helix transcriptional regulator [Streptomyces sp. NPDC054804]
MGVLPGQSHCPGGRAATLLSHDQSPAAAAAQTAAGRIAVSGALRPLTTSGACEQLRAAFTRDFCPAPVHYHASLYYLGDLAAAAVRAGRTDDARTVVDGVTQELKPDPSPRLAAVLHRATALLTDTDDAERHFQAALDGSGTDRWPFEKALAHLDFGEWLRRRRRGAEARRHLGAALECFERLDARPWTERAAAELRAAGTAGATAPAGELTPQERQIAELAAQGLTNRDIAARLYLSPCTVGYHLHKIFPKLGITARAQLRDALTAGEDTGGG